MTHPRSLVLTAAVLAAFVGPACIVAPRREGTPRSGVAVSPPARVDAAEAKVVKQLLSGPRTRALLDAWSRTPDLAPARNTVPPRSVRLVLDLEENGKVSRPTLEDEIERPVDVGFPGERGNASSPFRVVVFRAGDGAPIWWTAFEDPRVVRHERPGRDGSVVTDYERRAPARASVRIPFEPKAYVAWYAGSLPEAEPTAVFRLGGTPNAPVESVFTVQR